ncbi:hypothetical protein JD844_011744 [Phrynosoma platyrhinos]|uniref:Uncharacterized protein n=1 Tax=Phrynosoma platyrhinos TaxID=52577 RepID=A0ABQ7TK85_PHRPL|nr:hypothetical protein JD844_011744 [Phrynosoma platyrhinos]
MMDYLPGPHKKIFADCEKLQAYIREEEKTSCELAYNQENIVMSVFALFVAGSTATSDILNFAIFVMARLPHIQGFAMQQDAKWRDLRRFTLSTLKNFGMGKKTMSEKVQEEALCLVKDITEAIQAKVQEEINTVIGISRAPGMEDQMRMPFTNAVVHEVQRHKNMGLQNFTRSTTCYTEFRGFALPQDTVVIPYLTSVHFDPLKWETPEKFNPAHFLDEKGQFKKKDAFMPFSADNY